jgi:hypothetical protein
VKTLLVLSLILSSLNALSYDEALALDTIYGEDDRAEVESRVDLKLAKGIVVGVHSRYTYQLPVIDAPSLSERYNLCSWVNFAQQPSIGSCTGIHLGKGVVLTARHCIKTQYDCNLYKWAFNYNTQTVGTNSGFIELKDVYQCEKIIAADAKSDLTLIQLEKASRRKASLTLNRKEVVSESVYAIGSPLGLPLKNSGLGEVIWPGEKTIYAAIDVFQGNSGSPIFNENNKPIGILISGGEDFQQNTDFGCRENFVLHRSFGQEEVFLLQNMPEHLVNHIKKVQKQF